MVDATETVPIAARSSWIPRPRLLAPRPGAPPRVVILTGPPGSGKSVLAQQWREAGPDSSASLSLDAHDRDPTRLAGRLAAAHGPGPLARLVLDGVHVLEGSPALDLVEDLIERGPRHLALCLCSRWRLDAGLERLTGADGTVVWGPDDLAFTLEETRELVATRPDLALTPRHVEVLQARAEGWVGALQLAATALAGRRGTEIDTYVARYSGTDRRVRLLLQEAFAAADTSVQDFLLRTSVLDRLTPDLCDAVVGRSGSAAVLRRLGHTNQLVVPVGDAGEAARLHPLFATFLRHRLQARHPGDDVEGHRRAAAWCDAAGDHDTAIDHLIAARLYDEALDVVVGHLPELVRAHRPQVVQRWMRGFPPAFVARRPEYAVIDTVVGLGTGNGASLRPCRGTVLAHRSPALAPLIDAVVAVSLAASGDPGPALERGERARNGRRARPESARPALDVAASDLWSHLPVALARAAALLEDHEELQGWAETFEQEGSARPEDHVALLGARAWCEARHGRLRAAEARARAALDRAACHSRRLVGATVDAHLALGVVARERDQLTEAERALDEAVEVGIVRGQLGPVALAQLELARVASSLGAHDDAIGLVVGVARRPHGWPLPPFIRGAIDEVDARVHLAAGDVDRADALVARLEPGPDRSLLEARVLAARGEAERALPPVDAVLRDPTLNPRLRLEGGVLAGRLERERGHAAAARDRLAEVAAVAAREGHVRLYLDDGLDPPSPRNPVGPAGGPLWSQLSSREYQVLRHLLDRLDNREIGAAMYVSVNTVKTHLQSIYRKLGVESRREAVERARDIGLL